MDESEIVLHLDERIWDVIDEMEGTISIKVSEKRTLNLFGALYDIWETAGDNPEEARQLLVALTALLVAAPIGQADKVYEELAVMEGMKNFDLEVLDVLDEQSE